MKTPDEIKKGLECCHVGECDCDKCTYQKIGSCMHCLKQDALAYIRHLESRLAQAERERDAAVADLKVIKFCALCEEDKNTQEYGSDRCHSCVNKNKWRWRGVCEENTHDQP